MNLTIIDGRSVIPAEEVNKVVEIGGNFIVILNGNTIEQLCAQIGCDPIQKLERLGRWGVHALTDVLDRSDYEKLLKLQKEGFGIYFIEQMRLKRNRPPRLKSFLVYCEIRGIISHHDLLEDAKSSFFHYLESFRRERLFLMVGIYAWENNSEWVRLRSVF